MVFTATPNNKYIIRFHTNSSYGIIIIIEKSLLKYEVEKKELLMFLLIKYYKYIVYIMYCYPYEITISVGYIVIPRSFNLHTNNGSRWLEMLSSFA